MAFFFPPRELPQPDLPSMVRVVDRGDVDWNPPVFKAPPLVVKVPTSDEASFFAHSSVPKFERPSR